MIKSVFSDRRPLGVLGLGVVLTMGAGALTEPSSIGPYLPLVASFNRSAALMEQYKYAESAAGFEEVVAGQPDWIAARFNLGLAYLNMQGARGAEAHLDRAEAVFRGILEDEPGFPAAHYCLGMLYQHQGETEKALAQFEAVYGLDPEDPYVVYQYARALASAGRRDDALATYEKVLALDPGFVSAIYGLAQQYLRARQREKAMPLFARFKELQADELTAGSFMVRDVYGSAGKYYRMLGPDRLPLPSTIPEKADSLLFSPEVRALPGEVVAWEVDEETQATPGAAVGDIDGDGDLDLLLTADDKGGSARLWLNDGSGSFRPGEVIATRVLSPAMGDVDNDGDPDLWLGRAGGDQLLENDGRGSFSVVASPPPAPEVTTVCSRVVDADSDGDLDLLSFGRPTKESAADQAAVHVVLNNNRDGSYEAITEKLGLDLEGAPVTTVVHDDFDNDRDLDAVLFPAGDGAPLAWVNDRVWQYRMLGSEATGLETGGVVGATSGDPDKDGDQDLLLFSGDRVELWCNQGGFRFARDEGFGDRVGRTGGTMGQFADMDNDGDLDIVIPDGRRRTGGRGPTVLLHDAAQGQYIDQVEADPSNLLAALDTDGPAICVAADFTGNGFNDILLAAVGAPPRLVENITPGGNWIAFDLAGTRGQDSMSRSNRSAIGARVEIKSGPVWQQFSVGVPSGPTAAGPLRVHAGLGAQDTVEWLRVFWPDAVLQAELELAAGRVTAVEEIPRKTSSCPFLFAWTGERFDMISDFGGVGGLGYFLAPGSYAPPDATEYVPIPGLVPRDGEYVLQVLEPLEEVIYFDEAKLVAVDHPVGTAVYPNEMMAIGCPPPAFEIFCVRDPIEPVRAVDEAGRDITDRLATVDRRYAGATTIDHRFLGFAEPHAVELDFGDQLAGIRAGERVIFVAHGWVEYGYSGTNFAAYQAGMAARAPSFQVERDGQWVEVLTDIGYPAGVEHVMTLELTGILRPDDRKLRITSNMELYWDRMFLAGHVPAPLGIHELAADSADLHYLGYPREYSPDGRHPTLYDYSNVDTAMAWKLMHGAYTRYGDVKALLTDPDDCYVIMGRGEEVTLRFRADRLPPVPEGHRRSFLLKGDSYCKDMDLYTAFPDTVEPLPFHGMSGYPYGSDERYPDTEQTRHYRRTYNTRSVGGDPLAGR